MLLRVACREGWCPSYGISSICWSVELAIKVSRATIAIPSPEAGIERICLPFTKMSGAVVRPAVSRSDVIKRSEALCLERLSECHQDSDHTRSTHAIGAPIAASSATFRARSIRGFARCRRSCFAVLSDQVANRPKGTARSTARRGRSEREPGTARNGSAPRHAKVSSAVTRTPGAAMRHGGVRTSGRWAALYRTKGIAHTTR